MGRTSNSIQARECLALIQEALDHDQICWAFVRDHASYLVQVADYAVRGIQEGDECEIRGTPRCTRDRGCFTITLKESIKHANADRKAG